MDSSPPPARTAAPGNPGPSSKLACIMDAPLSQSMDSVNTVATGEDEVRSLTTTSYIVSLTSRLCITHRPLSLSLSCHVYPRMYICMYLCMHTCIRIPELPIASSFSPFSLSLIVRCAALHRAVPREIARILTHICAEHPTYFLPSFLPINLLLGVILRPTPTLAMLLVAPLFLSFFLPLLPLSSSIRSPRTPLSLRSSLNGLHVTRTRRRIARANFTCCRAVAAGARHVHVHTYIHTYIYIYIYTRGVEYPVQACVWRAVTLRACTYTSREKAGIRSCTTMHSVCRR